MARTDHLKVPKQYLETPTEACPIMTRLVACRTVHVAATTPLRTQHELQPVLRWLVLTTHWNNVDDWQGLGALPMARCRGWSCCNSAVGILQPS
jgi:hypothetical protein